MLSRRLLAVAVLFAPARTVFVMKQVVRATRVVRAHVMLLAVPLVSVAQLAIAARSSGR